MTSVAVRILHPRAAGLQPLSAALDAARLANAGDLRLAFGREGARDARIIDEVAPSFAHHVRSLAAEVSGGLVLLGSGAIPLARAADVRALLDVARSGGRRALANNRYSADAIAVGDATVLRDLPDLPGDNALPRWLEEVAGFEVDDLRGRWRLSMDLDSPLDVLLVGHGLPDDVDASRVRTGLEAIRGVARDRRRELVVAGRTSASTMRWLERSTASRTRVLAEERGLRASSRAALAEAGEPARVDAGGPAEPAPARPPRSVLGLVLDDRGPQALGAVLAELGDAAVVDSRVLLAHRLGVDERAWPRPEDRFASDLLLADRVRDPWLRALTHAAADAPIPIVLGGHSLVGPGLRLALGRRAVPR